MLFGTALLERLLASTQLRGNAVFALSIADSIGYTGSIAVQDYTDLFPSELHRFEFFPAFTDAFSLRGAGPFVASCVYFLPKAKPAE